MGCAITKADDSVMPPTKTDTVDFKARLEHKLYLARENPEPVFDLSECNLKQVPQGIYSLCKVFRKEALLLYNNQISSLDGGGSLNDLKELILLDLHSNAFIHLSPNIKCFTNLRELYLNDNQLKDLPDTICELNCLEILNISNNRLKLLPDRMGCLSSLRKFDLKGNSRLSIIPYSLCHCKYLNELSIDSDQITEPPSTITKSGVTAILKYFAEKYSINYAVPDELDGTQQDSYNRFGYNKNGTSILEEKIIELEKIKRQRHEAYLALEQQNEQLYQQELELQDAEKVKKEKFLRDLLEQQTKLESEVLKFQREKDEDRKNLIDHLLQVEQKADSIINSLLSLKNDPTYIGQCLEQERLEEERLLKVFRSEYDSLRRKDVLSAMEGLLQDESVRSELLLEYEMNKKAVTGRVLQQELESETALSDILRSQDANQSSIIHRLQLDESFQRAAVGALLERSDARCWGLVQQVKLVEIQLAELTRVEIQKKRMQTDAQVNDIAAMRVNLSSLLVDLLSQQGQRRNQLLDTLKRLEDEQKTSNDFWLLQYQKLMDSLPEHLKDINSNLDPVLTSYFLSEGVIHCLPFLANWIYSTDSDIDNLTNISEKDLLEAGVKNQIDRQSILRAINLYKEEKKSTRKKLGNSRRNSAIPGPSAPALTPDVSSSELSSFAVTNADEENEITRLQTAECVICMDNECQVIFVPCGHMCCCAQCSTSDDLQTCPMCRAVIEQKIRVILP